MKNEDLAKRIEQRLLELGRSPITAAVDVGLERTYLRDFLTGRKSSISTNKMDLVAKALGWTVTELTGETNTFVDTVPVEAILGPDFEPSDLGPRDVPVLGTAMGGTEDDERPVDFWLTGEVENHVARPKGLARAKNVFALYVGGDSMIPRFEERDMVYVQRTSPGIGDDVVIELHPRIEGGDHPTLIKRLVRKNGSFITVKQYNPPKELEFGLQEIRNLFRVVPLKELMG